MKEWQLGSSENSVRDWLFVNIVEIKQFCECTFVAP